MPARTALSMIAAVCRRAAARRPCRTAVPLAGVVAAGLAGCGLGAGATPAGIGLTVSAHFGSDLLQRAGSPRVVGQETVMQLLMRNDRVSTRYGGGFVQSIGGHAGGRESSRPLDWFFYVNGVEGEKGAADTRLHRGDQVWWDLHDWSVTPNIPAVVGAYPEPFLHGVGGSRLPVTVYCTQPRSSACHTVSARLRAEGVPIALGALGTDEPHTLRVLVGPWNTLRVDVAADNLRLDPRTTGVYARFVPRANALTLLDAGGSLRRELTSGAGLIAATRLANEVPTWLVTGTDAAGVQAAAMRLDRSSLRDRFAVAVTSSAVIGLPLGGR